jgi:pimeloyl-ACP methyl ester carboxylesterase
VNGSRTPIENTLGIGSLALHFVTWGQRTQPERAVALVHGLTASHCEWVELGPALAAQGYYVIAPDLRGRGLSAKPPHGYGAVFHANDLLSLCDALNLPTVNVVGHSLGSFIAMYLAALYPSRIGKIVLVDAGGKVPADTAQAIAASVSRLGTVYPSLDAYLAVMSQLPMFEWSPFWEQYFRYDAVEHEDGTVTSRVPKAAIDEENAANFALRLDVLPEYIRKPTLILRAALGTLGPDRGIVLPVEEAERMRGLIPGSRVVVVPDTNHYTIILSPVFQQAVTAFLAGDTEWPGA